ncbi:MAG: hypothetical protein N4A72_01550 [Bacteroidales bacterium]|jgi:hypothetical protein|nr:hypothetical protein [Bacteroidales bacterium]
MSDQSSGDIIVNYAKSRGYKYFTSTDAKQFVVAPVDRISKKKIVYFKVNDIVFVAFDSYTVKAGSTNIFCGVYTTLDRNSYQDTYIIKREFVTRLFTINKVKTGNSYIDKKLIVSASGKSGKPIGIRERDADMFLDIHRQFAPLKIRAYKDWLNDIKEFNSKFTLGLEINRWILDFKELDSFIEKGSELIKSIKKRN